MSPGAPPLAVTDDANSSVDIAGRCVGSDKQLVRTELGGAIQVDGVGRRCRWRAMTLLYLDGQRRLDDVLGAVDMVLLHSIGLYSAAAPA
jgi:hypothetical protein